MKKLILLSILLIVGCEEVLDPDTTAPTVVITYPINNSTLDSTATVTVDVADDGDIGIVKLLVDGIVTYADTTAPYQFQWDVCVQATGTHTLMAKTEDGAGNQGQSDLLTFPIDANYDCESVCGGDKLLDNCEVCDADTTNDCAMDCANIWGGDSVEDNCAICDDDTTNDCVQDCANVWGGTSWMSDCGCVLATNSGNDCDDCYGTPNGTATIDVCGNCIGGTTGLVNGDTDSDGICNTLQGTVTDIDGNTYKTIIIGTQTWMGENLNVSKYNNGDAIPNVTDSIQWVGLTSGAYCDFNNDESISTTHGRLYNWYTASDSPGLCMDGWSVPTDAEWQTLVVYLGDRDYAGGKMKISGTEYWASPNSGATNESGFTAVAMGYISESAKFNLDIVGENARQAWWWSSTSYSETRAWERIVSYNNTKVQSNSQAKIEGYSIRCLKD